MNRILVRTAACFGLVAIPFTGFAADHIDAPGAAAEPTADITDVFAWMNTDADKLNLVMNVHHMAGETATFSEAVVYVLHVNSSSAYLEPQTETNVVCQFYTADAIECWAGDEYVTGDPSDTDGLTSASGKLRVFAGRRDDPFFFELTGFKETVAAAVAAAPTLTFDAEGCPDIGGTTSDALVAQLAHGVDGADASNTFAGSSVLSIAVELDKTVVDAGGPILSVWGSTHASN
jgi:hypothetical protein